MTPIENPQSQISEALEQLPLSLLNDYLYCPRRAAALFAQFRLQVARAVQYAQQTEAIRQHFAKDQFGANRPTRHELVSSLEITPDQLS